MMRILMVGATSAIAQAFLRELATGNPGEPQACFLVARNAEGLALVAQDLKVRGVQTVLTRTFEAREHAAHPKIVEEAWQALGGVDLAFLAHGIYPAGEDSEDSFSVVQEILEVNTLGVISWLIPLGRKMEAAGRGQIAVLGSVAGERGRRTNYAYGTSKAALHTFLQGFRAKMHPFGVHVLTIKPGFVDTPMTRRFRKNFLFASPEGVARAIGKALRRKREVLYVPWFWGWIFLVLRAIPEKLFKRLKI